MRTPKKKNTASSHTKKRSSNKRKNLSTTPSVTASFLPIPALSGLSSDSPIIPKAEELNINQLFSQAFMRHKKEELIDKKQKLKEVGHLASMAEEFLSTFALIGYSLQDEKVVIFNMKTSKDEAALVDLLRATFVELVQNRP